MIRILIDSKVCDPVGGQKIELAFDARTMADPEAGRSGTSLTLELLPQLPLPFLHLDDISLPVGTEQAGQNPHIVRSIAAVDHHATVMRCDLHRRMHLRGGRPADNHRHIRAKRKYQRIPAPAA